MPNRRSILTILLVLVPQALAQQPVTSPTDQPKPATLTIDQVLQLSTAEQILDVSGERGAKLVDLLSQATDEATAQRILPEAQRCFLETCLVEMRLGMLPQPTDQDRVRLQPITDPIRKTQERLVRQAQRIQNSPALAKILEPVARQIYLEDKHRSTAVANSLNSQLQTVRSQIELYALQHNDKRPDFRNQGWSQLTQVTRADGRVDPAGDMGPYLASLPINHLNNCSRILIARSTPQKDFRYPGGDCGFIFDESTGKFWALDAEGKLFNESRIAAQVDVR
jgi:hypothetical protein